MNIDRLMKRIADHEGFRPWVYDDATGAPIVKGYTVQGHPTVGYGMCLDHDLNCGLTSRQANRLLEDRVMTIARDFDRRIEWWRRLRDPATEALVEMAYQLGVDGLLGFTRLIAAGERAAAGDTAAYRDMCGEALDSKWAREDSPERAREVAALFMEMQS